ncbi:LysM peptidoglycan-binding domain-containing protein [Chloroflexi bacterium TSY]|nr:LysM peptidoglycan-binding domain-containing protein [Chloroflexi bacterium TSY]
MWTTDSPVVARQQAQETDNETVQDIEQHVVQRGESLSQIAKQYGVTMTQLMQLNAIVDADAIYIGQTLQLPPVEFRDPQQPVLPEHNHTIKRGETLSELAQEYNVSLIELLRYNGIQDADAIYIGQTIQIPVKDVEEKAEEDGGVERTGQGESEEKAEENGKVEDVEAAEEIEVDSTKSDTDDTTSDATSAQSEIDTGDDSADESDLPGVNEGTPTETADSEDEKSREKERTNSDDESTQISSVDQETQPEITEGKRTTTLNRSVTVKFGDTLARVALRNGVDLESLRQVNGLTQRESGRLRAGQELILPATGEELVVKKPVPSEQKYVVQAGDSLGAIAKSNNLTIADLLAVNRITNPDSLAIGRTLVLPSPKADEPNNSVENAGNVSQVGAVRSGYYFYMVRPGDTLSDVASDFNSTILALIEYNGLPNAETVYSGLELRIPFGPPPHTTRQPRIPTSGTRFMVSLSRQQCWVFRGDQIVHEWTCSTGYGQWTTQTGNFAVKTRLELAKSGAHRLDMPYWLGIYDVGAYENGIHGLPIRWSTGKKIWSDLIGQPATFGCAMLADEEASQLFDLSYLGMPVQIVD